jgi:RNA polymerase sigma-70 factor (ECF subfamily)
MAVSQRTELGDLSDEAVVDRIRAGDAALFEILMRRHNARVFRAVRSIVKTADEAEDVMQEAYVNAYAHIGGFEGRSSVATWLTRIAVHEAFARVRRGRRIDHGVDPESEDFVMHHPEHTTPETRASDHEHRALLEDAIDALPEHYRTAFVLRAVEELSVAETAEVLEVSEETVKTRLHRARIALQESLLERTRAATPAVFGFHLSRCDRVVNAVLERIGKKAT